MASASHQPLVLKGGGGGLWPCCACRGSRRGTGQLSPASSYGTTGASPVPKAAVSSAPCTRNWQSTMEPSWPPSRLTVVLPSRGAPGGRTSATRGSARCSTVPHPSPSAPHASGVGTTRAWLAPLHEPWRACSPPYERIGCSSSPPRSPAGCIAHWREIALDERSVPSCSRACSASFGPDDASPRASSASRSSRSVICSIGRSAASGISRYTRCALPMSSCTCVALPPRAPAGKEPHSCERAKHVPSARTEMEGGDFSAGVRMPW